MRPWVRQQVCSPLPPEAFDVIPPRAYAGMFAIQRSDAFSTAAHFKRFPAQYHACYQYKYPDLILRGLTAHIRCWDLSNVGTCYTPRISQETDASGAWSVTKIPCELLDLQDFLHAAENILRVLNYTSCPGGVAHPAATVAFGIVSLMRWSRYSPCETGGHEAPPEPCAAVEQHERQSGALREGRRRTCLQLDSTTGRMHHTGHSYHVHMGSLARFDPCCHCAAHAEVRTPTGCLTRCAVGRQD